MTDTKNDTKILSLATDVLVVGGGWAGLAAARSIADLGYGVILIEKGDQLGRTAVCTKAAPEGGEALLAAVNDNANISVLLETELVRAAGVPGDFTVRLKKQGQDKTLEKKVGAVVVATDFDRKPLNDAYGLALGGKVLSQSDLEAKLAVDPKALATGGEVTDVAFLVGFGQEGNALVMERVFKNIEALKKIEGMDVYVFIGNVKLAADGLDRLFAQARKEGVLYFKSDEAPAITDDLTITTHDPVLRKDLELAADLVVVEEQIAADPENEVLASLLRLDLHETGFIQPDNVHLFPVKSNREGIYVVGAARDLQNLPAGWMDAESAALEVKALLGDGTVEVPAGKAVVNVDKCTICLTCYRACPHGAIYWDSRAIVSPVACQACGICASECPMEAIQVGDFDDASMEKRIALAMENKIGGPSIVAFCCENSAHQARKQARAFGMPLPENLEIVKVPCAGKIDLDYILDAFVNGADGVLVYTCHPGNCKSLRGNTYASWRVKDAKRRLEAAGVNPERLRYAATASCMGVDFSNVTMEMEKALKEMS